MVMVDNFSRFVTLGALPDWTSNTLARWLNEHVVCIYGAPELVKFDGGGEFRRVFEAICEALKIRHQTTLPYHP